MNTQAYRQALEGAAALIAAEDDSFFSGSLPRQALLDSSVDVLANLDADIAKVLAHKDALFAAPERNDDPRLAGHKLARAFTDWRKDPPSATALVIVAARHLGIPADNAALQGSLMAALAADVALDNPYHNNSHFREVTAMMARLCDANNTLAKRGVSGAEHLSADNLAKALMAALGHDLLHDGKGNAPQGPEHHEQYRLENRSIAALEPLMALAGMPPSDKEDLRVMIRVTDVTAKQGETSPHKLLRQAFKAGFEGGAAPALPQELAALQDDRTLLVMAALMSDADLGPSAATNYIFGFNQTRLISRENPQISPSDQSLKGFLSFVVEGKFLSPAAGAVAQVSLSDTFNKTADRIARKGPSAAPAPQKRKP